MKPKLLMDFNRLRTLLFVLLTDLLLVLYPHSVNAVNGAGLVQNDNSSADGLALTSNVNIDSHGSIKHGPIKENKVVVSNKTPFNISRLQGRVASDGCESFTQSSFVQWPSQIFILELIDVAKVCDNFSDYSRLEVNIGGPFMPSKDKYSLGWVLRDQAVKDQKNVASLGVQLNLSNMQWLKESAKKHRFNIFYQLFTIKNDNADWDYDSLLYIRYRVSNKLDIRGTASYVSYSNEDDYKRYFTDFIHPLGKKWDTYLRYVYQNRDDQQYGPIGSQWLIGFRYNIKI